MECEKYQLRKTDKTDNEPCLVRPLGHPQTNLAYDAKRDSHNFGGEHCRMSLINNYCLVGTFLAANIGASPVPHPSLYEVLQTTTSGPREVKYGHFRDHYGSSCNH